MAEVPLYKLQTDFFQSNTNSQNIISELKKKYQYHSGISDLFDELQVNGQCDSYSKDRIFYVGYILSKENIPFDVYLPNNKFSKREAFILKSGSEYFNQYNQLAEVFYPLKEYIKNAITDDNRTPANQKFAQEIYDFMIRQMKEAGLEE